MQDYSKLIYVVVHRVYVLTSFCFILNPSLLISKASGLCHGIHSIHCINMPLQIFIQSHVLICSGWATY